MPELPHHNKSLGEIHESVDMTKIKPGWKKIFSFIGPAYLVSVGYMDPGNWATDLAGGSKYGFTLIWVLLLSNLMAIVLQSFSARLGIVRGRDLAQANRESYPKKINFLLWLLAEIAIAATDLAEVLGMAIGLQLLFGLPLLIGVSITVIDTFLLLYLQRLGMRKIEAFIIMLIGIIAFSFLINIIIAQPSIHLILKGFIPSLPDASTLYNHEGITGKLPKETALYIAIGMIGATVMPHNLYLHSSLIQTRKIKRDHKGIKEALKWSVIDSTIALNAAFLINAAILILAATVFFQTGRTDVGEIKKAHELLSPVLGNNFASTLFAIALIASGQSSTITGTLSGQIVMEGYLSIRINPMLRRLITRLVAIIPAIIFIAITGEDDVDSLLIFSQVILSVQLGFAVIPLIHFVSDKKTMSDFAIKPWVQIIGWSIAALLIFLNGKLLLDETASYFAITDSLIIKSLVIVALLFFTALLIYILLFPILKKNHLSASIEMHPEVAPKDDFHIHEYHRIAVALDFSDNDFKLISGAISQAGNNKEFILIHIVESPAAKLHGDNTADYETDKDRERLSLIAKQMEDKGYKVKGVLGFKERSKELIRIIKEENADILVIGAHGHKGIKDFIYGTTIDKVRHELHIPVFIVK